MRKGVIPLGVMHRIHVAHVEWLSRRVSRTYVVAKNSINMSDAKNSIDDAKNSINVPDAKNSVTDAKNSIRMSDAKNSIGAADEQSSSSEEASSSSSDSEWAAPDPDAPIDESQVDSNGIMFEPPTEAIVPNPEFKRETRPSEIRPWARSRVPRTST